MLDKYVQDEAGGGLVFWHPKGAIVRHIIEDAWKKIHLQRGYDLLYTPHVAKADLWKISGHLDFYKENMFDQMEIEDELYQLRPMNCPYHILVYKRQLHSYRDFPIRVAELGTVYRYELSGSLHGLFRVRGFTQVYVCSFEISCIFWIFLLPSNICGSQRSPLPCIQPNDGNISKFSYSFMVNLILVGREDVATCSFTHSAVH